MNRERFDYLCLETEAGRDAFVIHPATLEEGLVQECHLPSQHLVVRTAGGAIRCWDFHECEELARLKKEWPRH